MATPRSIDVLEDGTVVGIAGVHTASGRSVRHIAPVDGAKYGVYVRGNKDEKLAWDDCTWKRVTAQGKVAGEVLSADEARDYNHRVIGAPMLADARKELLAGLNIGSTATPNGAPTVNVADVDIE